MNSNYNSIINLSGLNIYHIPEKNIAIYHCLIPAKNYVIDGSNVQAFSSWRLRLPISVLIAGIMAMMKINILVAIAAGSVIYIVSTILFRRKFLSKLEEYSDFKMPVYKSVLHSIAARYTRVKLLQTFATFLALALIVFIAVFSGRVDESVKSAAIAIIILAGLSAAFTYFLIHLKFTDKQLIKEEEKLFS